MEHNTYYLCHHGIKGQKWGVRRFRNADGTLTAAGKKRAKTLSDSQRVNKIRKKKVSQMSNEELRDANNRLQLERQYKDLTKKTSTGKKIALTIIATAGTIESIERSYKVYKRVGEAIKKKYDDIPV